jgi:hypothetical protein
MRLIDWLRRLDAAVLEAWTSPPAPSTAETVWSSVVAAVGAAFVLVAALLLQSHAPAQLAAVAAGMLLTVPYLQCMIDKARATAEE